MARIDALIPDALAKRLRVTVAQRFGGKKGDLTRGLTEAIELWVQSDEAARVARKLAKNVRDPKTPSSVKESAVAALAKAGPAGVLLLRSHDTLTHLCNLETLNSLNSNQ